jgi:type III pantothenate kinase
VTQGPHAPGFVLVSIGNSRAAVARCDRSAVLAGILRIPSASFGADAIGPGAEPVHLVSVVPEHGRHLAVALRAAGRAVTWWGEDREIPVRHPYAPPERPGADRLVAALAAHRRVQGACIVVDAGTAVTVDAVAPDGSFLGGAIGPGIAAIAEGLRAKAPVLPRAGPDSTGYPAQSSAGAVSLGVRAAFSGGLFVLVVKAVKALGHVPVVVTGGDSGPAAEALASFHPTVVPELLLEGLAHLALSS